MPAPLDNKTIQEIIEIYTTENISAKEMARRLNLNDATVCKYSYLFILIGANDIENEGEFKWVDGTPLDSTKGGTIYPHLRWADNEPNNDYGRENYVHISTEKGRTDFIYINDIVNDNKYIDAFIVEFDGK